MKIEIKDDEQTLVITNEELDNANFVDLELYDDEAKDKDNPRGYITEFTAPLEELVVAVNCFWNIKKNAEKRL